MLLIEEELEYLRLRAAAGDFELVEVSSKTSTEATFVIRLHEDRLTIHLSEAGFKLLSLQRGSDAPKEPADTASTGYPTIEGLLMSHSQQFTDDFFAKVCNKLSRADS